VAAHQKKAREANATIAFIDEAGMMMAPLVRRTWAPRGATPTIYQRGRSHNKVSVIGAICTSPHGRRLRMFFRLYPNENVDAALCVDFLRQLRQNIKGPIIVVWDRLLAHRSKKVKRHLEQERRITLEYLPPYAPELNPIEYMWGYVKMNPMANFTPTTDEELLAKTKSAICETRCQRDLLRSFIRHSGLPLFHE
jgi:transposase